MADMAAREGASSARRRRDRQLRAWHRHVRTTVAMELATALHHSAQGWEKRVVEEPREEELPVKHNATSGQNATPPWGVRPAHPLDVSEQPPLVAATCVAAGVPLLGVPSLADAPAEAIDGRTLRYLLKVNLARKKKEEEEQERKAEEEEHEKRMLEIHSKVRADEAVTDAEWSAWKAWRGIGSSSSGVKKRKRKKRRKKRLPKSSPLRSARTWYSGQSSTSPLPSSSCSVSTCRVDTCSYVTHGGVLEDFFGVWGARGVQEMLFLGDGVTDPFLYTAQCLVFGTCYASVYGILRVRGYGS